ncbi:MliC family protein [Rubrivirga sp. S365]|uniref:MliC family protein n=1 Tax=Rubrivirga litoralis TaxID=3075598 RepID=A0ABU3BPF6_9BACT|nr:MULTISPECIES: MliC family protein [unclassified Rubrivirga]MDT0631167.1 MliC family protein [Rubrivirga sp. F394]MDT7856690.1 MliC family protein [Rubrivirga sp. S365]
MRLFLTVLLIAAVQGCSSPSNETTAELTPEPTAEPAAAAAPQTMYTCESGSTIQASYPTTETAVVEYEGQTLPMTIAVSGSGSRYVGDELEWWTQGAGVGSEGTLFRHNSDGTSGEMVESCEASA